MRFTMKKGEVYLNANDLSKSFEINTPDERADGAYFFQQGMREGYQQCKTGIDTFNKRAEHQHKEN